MGKYGKHHYIPKSLLRMFTFQNDSLWQFSKSKNKTEQKNVNNIGYQMHLYKADVKDNTIDPLFFEKEMCPIEDKAITIIKKISKDNYQLNADDREILTLYLVLLDLRTPAKKDEMSIMADKLITPLFIEEMKLKGKLDEGITDNFQNYFGIELDNNGHLGNILHCIPEFSKILFSKHWTFATCDQKTSFIISDNPSILYSHPTNIHKGGLIQEGSFKFFPLRSDLCLFMSDPTELFHSFICLSKSEVRSVNIDLMSHSKEFSYGKSDIQLNSITKKASLEPFSINDTYEITNLKTFKENEEILWGHLFYSKYINETIKQKIYKQIKNDTEKYYSNFKSPPIVMR